MAKFDIYEAITSRIIEALENGIIPWERPWATKNGRLAVSHATGKPYSLLNQMILDKPGEYLTFNQVQQAGGRVKKGEKSRMVVFWKWLKVKDADTEEEKEIPFLKYFNVFHIEQCEGVEPKHVIPDEMPETPVNTDETAQALIDAYLKASGVKMYHEEGDRAFYRPADDSITLPLLEQFKHTAEYYSTAFHEMVHSTGHASRLNRLDKVAAFGSADYSKEELVAEIGAATLVNQVGLETVSSFKNSAAYVQSWIKVLKNDKRFIVSAAGKAEKAVNWILGDGKASPNPAPAEENQPENQTEEVKPENQTEPVKQEQDTAGCKVPALKKHKFYSHFSIKGVKQAVRMQGYTDGQYNYYRSAAKSWTAVHPATGLSVGTGRTLKEAQAVALNVVLPCDPAALSRMERFAEQFKELVLDAKEKAAEQAAEQLAKGCA